jgi:bilin biosynthesis protein
MSRQLPDIGRQTLLLLAWLGLACGCAPQASTADRAHAPAIPGLIEAMKEDAFVFQTEPGIHGATKTLAEMGSPAVEPLIRSLSHEDYRIRVNAAKALGEIGDSKALAPLCAAMTDEVWRVRVNAGWAVEKLGAPAVDALVSLLASDAPRLREAAALGLGRIQNRRAVPALRTAFGEDRDVLVRASAAWALGELKDRDSMDTLIAGLKEKNNLIKASSLTALRKITGIDLGQAAESWQLWRENNRK